MVGIQGAGEVVTGAIRYVDPGHATGVVYALNPEKNEVRYEEHVTEITDARPALANLDLDANGFTLVRHTTRVTDFREPAQTESIYRKEMEELVQRVTGARKVIVFHMQMRDSAPAAAENVRRPAPIAHIDYDEETFRIRAREEMGEEAEQWLSMRFSAINVWRGIRPVEEMPLAVCDARTIRGDQLFKATIHERVGDPRPYTALNLSFDKTQRWYYFRDMQPDEALLFKLCDTNRRGGGRVPHAAFKDPRSKANARPRLSFEVRTMAFFDDP